MEKTLKTFKFTRTITKVVEEVIEGEVLSENETTAKEALEKELKNSHERVKYNNRGADEYDGRVTGKIIEVKDVIAFKQ